MDSILNAIKEVMSNNGNINIAIVNSEKTTHVSINCSTSSLTQSAALQRSNVNQEYLYTGSSEERVTSIKNELGIDLNKETI